MAVTNDMSADRRVARHAATLRDAGYVVKILCRDKQYRHEKGWRFYAEYNMELRRRLLLLKPDAVWANDTDTLLGCYMAARRLHCPLVLDAHELFPEVPEIQYKPLVRWVWRTLERWLMPCCAARITVCQSIANYYKEKYGLDFTVIRNIPERPNYPENTIVPEMPVLLYQGSVNLGRGVDWAIDALEYLPQCRLTVAGKGDLLEQMKAYAASKPWADRITFLGHVPPEELPALTKQASVGLVMLEDIRLSYHYALPNRIGDFVAAGVPMVVSDLPEMASVIRRYGVGEVIDRLHGADGKAQARALAEAVKRVLAREWNEADFAEARKDMDWNKEKQKLIQLCCTTFC